MTGCGSCGCGCCGTCSTGGHGGHGGSGAGSGSGSVLVDSGVTTDWTIRPGGCSLIVPGPRLVPHCDPSVCCRCVCACDCCMPCGGPCGGHGDNGPGMRVDMSYPGYDVIAPAAYLCSNAHCGHASTSCCDPCCCGPC